MRPQESESLVTEAWTHGAIAASIAVRDVSDTRRGTAAPPARGEPGKTDAADRGGGAVAVDDWDMWDRRERARLSPRERLALLEIEAHPREDRGFARREVGGAHRERRDEAQRGNGLPTGELLLTHT